MRTSVEINWTKAADVTHPSPNSVLFISSFYKKSRHTILQNSASKKQKVILRNVLFLFSWHEYNLSDRHTVS